MCKELAKELRGKLKELGYNRNMVSVTSDYDSIHITVKSIDVNFKKVEEFANSYEKIDRDYATGEILCGCNTYVNVSYGQDLVKTIKENYKEKSEEIFKIITERNSLECVFANDNYRVLYSSELHQLLLQKYEKEQGWFNTIERHCAYNTNDIQEGLAYFFMHYRFDVEIVAETEEQQQQEEIKEVSNAPKQTQNNNSIEFEVKEDIHTKTGVKIFVAKLAQKVEYEEFKLIESKIKSIGGYYSRFKKGFIFSEEPTQLLNDTFNDSECIEEIQNIKEIEYPDIDINDIETYTVSKELSQRENNNSMFRREDKDHNKEIQSIMQNANNEILEALEGNTKPYTEYRAKQYLQNWKKKYYTLYIKMLNHKANNPSWMVTGRGNLNVNRYNKKQSQYEKMIGESVGLTEEFNKKISSIKWEIEKKFNEQERKETEKLMNSNIDIPKFEKKTIKINMCAVDNIFNNGDREIKVNYYQGYYIFNNWGCWRCYNDEGKEIFQTKTTGTLLEAKKKLIVLLSNKSNIAV